MNYKKVALIFGISATLIFSAGCGSKTTETTAAETTAAETADTSDQDMIQGEVTAVSDSSITISDSNGTETEYTVTDDTTITKMSGMGQGGQMPSGDNSQMPNGSGQTGDGSTGSSESGSDGTQQTPPEMPSGSDQSAASSDGTQQTPPEMPSGSDQNAGGSASGSDGTQQTPPEMPSGSDQSTGESAGSGDSTQQSMPAMPDNNGQQPSGDGTQQPSGDGTQQPSGDGAQQPSGDGTQQPSGDGAQQPSGDGTQQPSGDMQMTGETITLADISVGDTVMITLADDGSAATIVVSDGTMGQPGDMGGGQSSGVESYDAATEYTEDTEVSGETLSSTGTDENAVHAYNGATVTLNNVTITKDSDNSTGGDNSSFYGVGAALLETDGTTIIKDSTITTDSAGGAGAFAYGDGTIYISDTSITTEQDTSGGIHVAGGGTLYAWNVTAETNGESSAAIRSDRGGGTMVVDGGSYTSNGTGSPAVYCTADIAINDAELTATNSEAVCIEGLNDLHLFDCDLTGSMPDNEQNDCKWNVILYQSMSGDSEVGNSTFEMNGGTLTAGDGGIFYTTNTESTFILDNVDIVTSTAPDFFLKCTGNSNQRGWGTSGANGADCTFTAIEQEMNGDIVWDSISNLKLYMTSGSTLTGAVIDDESNAGNGGDGTCDIVIDKDSKWIVTGDSTVTNLSCSGTITDESGKTVTIKDTDGNILVKGDSSYTITVSSYSTDADTQGASAASSWSDYEVEQQ